MVQDNVDSLNVYTDVAADYAKYRCSYPAEAIDTILAGLGDPAQIIAADVGAGTGIASRLFAERGVRVFAIEPNLVMRQSAQPHSLVEFRDATAETTYLPDASADLVTCFCAFHWFDRAKSLLEFHRILKPSGRLALVWNFLNPQDKFTRNYIGILQKASRSTARQTLLSPLAPLLKPWLSGKLWLSLRRHHFRHVHYHEFPYRQDMDLPALIGLARTQSFISRDEETQKLLAADLQQLYSRWTDHSGLVPLIYRASVFLAERSDAHEGSFGQKRLN